MNKPIEFWAVIIGMGLWFFIRTPNTESMVVRALRTFASAALGIGLSLDVSSYFRVGESLAAVGVMAFGMLLLDGLSALLSNQKFMETFLRKKMGVGKDDQ